MWTLNKEHNSVVIGSLLLSVVLLCVLNIAYRVPASQFLAEVKAAVLVNLTNQSRAEGKNIGTLTISPLLTQAAQMKAEDMIAYGYFAHTNPVQPYKTPWYWFDEVGYPFNSWRGENLAVDFTTSESVHRAWMRSSGHRENILLDRYTDIGVGIAQGMVNGVMTTVVVELFGGMYE